MATELEKEVALVNELLIQGFDPRDQQIKFHIKLPEGVSMDILGEALTELHEHPLLAGFVRFRIETYSPGEHYFVSMGEPDLSSLLKHSRNVVQFMADYGKVYFLAENFVMGYIAAHTAQHKAAQEKAIKEIERRIEIEEGVRNSFRRRY